MRKFVLITSLFVAQHRGVIVLWTGVLHQTALSDLNNFSQFSSKRREVSEALRGAESAVCDNTPVTVIHKLTNRPAVAGQNKNYSMKFWWGLAHLAAHEQLFFLLGSIILSL